MSATSGPAASAVALTHSIQSLRPFVPAKDFGASRRFYQDLGFELRHDGSDIAIFGWGDVSFLLQNFHAPGLAENFVVQLAVSDVAAWWRMIEPLDLAARHGVKAPLAPKPMPWGATVIFLFDPSGVLWHIAEFPAAREG
ncbi:MAG TPA: VOC family protein [Caulobacteraceae bacterium]|nr:VOC family protein [Caulobacteraceae bacterium]